eukprot:5401054-Amphidinium_carterae.1
MGVTRTCVGVVDGHFMIQAGRHADRNSSNRDGTHQRQNVPRTLRHKRRRIWLNLARTQELFSTSVTNTLPDKMMSGPLW